MKNEENSYDSAKIIDIAQGRAELIVQRSTAEDETNETNYASAMAVPVVAHTNGRPAMTDNTVVNMNFNLGKDQTVTDIIDRLLPFIHDEMRMPAGVIKDVIEEIERLRDELNRWKKIADSLVGALDNDKTRHALIAWAEEVYRE